MRVVPARRGQGAAPNVRSHVPVISSRPHSKPARRSRMPISRELSGAVSTRIARKSFTLVNVGPGVRIFAKFLKEFGRIVVVKKRGRIEAEAPGPGKRGVIYEGARGGPRPARPHHRFRRCRRRGPRSRSRPPAHRQRQRIFLFGPPLPLPRSVTVSSPPERITARRPWPRRSRASRAWATATSRASPSIAVPSMMQSYPLTRTACSIVRNHVSGSDRQRK